MQAIQRPLLHLLYLWCVGCRRQSQASVKLAIVFCLATVVLSETVTPLDQSPSVVTAASIPQAATTALPKMTIASSCHSRPCALQEALPCRISVLHSYCMMRKKNETDFPDSPRELKINHKVLGNRRIFNITWRAPYDYSYKVLEGFEMLLNVWRNDTGGMPECIFFNLSGVDWSRVNNIHNVLFFFDCWHEAVETDLKIRLRLSSYPRASRNSPSISSNITVSGRPNKREC